ncbi:DUF6518 family protein [Nocardiopsis sp. N85]|uniref:DUF6518 family protein n=1 Tax=Nocardiopsis sp. N85 TaxID=3029400 RepID=UPI00237EFABC|nr:DUF6518 family protein [Nocardiopsis sp. N85]MDE3724654.1 DUF6518 family protein [Nocardiopsis sp. N85]
MSEKLPTRATVSIKRIFWSARPEPPPGTLRAFLDRYPWLVLVTAAALGFVCGLASEAYVFKWNIYSSVSVGLFVLPPVLVGWLAVRRGWAATLGAAVLVAAVLGHFIGGQSTEYARNQFEYQGWAFTALWLGPLLGVCGNRLRSARAVTAALSAAVPVSLILIPLYLAYRGLPYYADHANPYVTAFDLCGVALLILLCRGIAARGGALLCTPVFTYLFSSALLYGMFFLAYVGRDL